MANQQNLKLRLYIVSASILTLGLCCSVVLYFAVGDVDTDSPLGNPLDESKSYRRSLELYGGKANLLTAEFAQWFFGLWRGRSLALTIASLSAVLSLATFLFAYHLPSDTE
jgi:hypothetical protein